MPLKKPLGAHRRRDREGSRRSTTKWLREVAPILQQFMKGETWLPSLAFLFNQRLDAEGGAWTVTFGAYAHGKVSPTGRRGVRFFVTARFMPPLKLPSSIMKRLQSSGHYEAISAMMQQAGYSGDWQKAPAIGRWGEFQKDLPNFHALDTEMQRIERLSLESSLRK